MTKLWRILNPLLDSHTTSEAACTRVGGLQGDSVSFGIIPSESESFFLVDERASFVALYCCCPQETPSEKADNDFGRKCWKQGSSISKFWSGSRVSLFKFYCLHFHSSLNRSAVVVMIH